MGRKEDFLKYPDLMNIISIAELIFLFFLIGLSFLRTYFVCKSIVKKTSGKLNPEYSKVPLNMRLFFVCVIMNSLVLYKTGQYLKDFIKKFKNF